MFKYFSKYASLKALESFSILFDDTEIDFQTLKEMIQKRVKQIEEKVKTQKINIVNSQNLFSNILEIIATWELSGIPVIVDPNLTEFEFANIKKTLSACDDLLPDKVALILFTSGSSSEPKPILHSFNSLGNSVVLSNNFIEHKNDTWLLSLQLFHIGGFQIFLRALLSGSKLFIPQKIDTQNIFKSCITFKPTLLSFVPTLFKNLIEKKLQPWINLRFVFLGGEACDDLFLKKLVQQNWPIVKVYGSTETASMIAAEYITEKNVHSSGIVFKKVEIKFASDGEIKIKSPTLYMGSLYKDRIVKNTDAEGYFLTGDLGKLDKNKSLIITGRKKDIIISGGKNINPAEIEICLKALPNISDALVFGRKDKTWGEAVIAIVEMENSSRFSEVNIKKELSGKISSYKIPKKIYVINKFPLTPTGKTDKRKLEKLFNKFL